MLYASVVGADATYPNRIVTVDPDSGAILSSVRAGTEPNALAISGDGSALYVGIDGRGSVQRFALPAMTPGWEFTLGQSSGRTMTAEDIDVMPGHPNTIAVARMVKGLSPRHEGVVIVDTGVQRPSIVSTSDSINDVEFGAAATVLYGADTRSACERSAA